MKKYTASNRTKILFLCFELLLFISFICVLQNVNHGIHYNPRTCQQNDKSRNKLINSRQLALLHGPGLHNHCTETIESRDLPFTSSSYTNCFTSVLGSTGSTDSRDST
ncbi:hypothetical protein AK88_05557 [Plasmodium fragile]|uniref:Uncharacterized protein n=1 Tax=Plasmodium fragile TaxID=5857 RepID=A0A0D9QCS6_PLAFR|nr:uncharacterized protein AK88_05557 [Plasmodium fragile]KJP84813.1 hypothetical protein AK88_05557 [Plasmodium fragile]